MANAFITGVAGEALSPAEASFLRSSLPVGFILFARNCISHEQIRRLVGDVREAVGADDFLVLIDQEGGRVQRLRPPLGRALPAADAYARLYAEDTALAQEAAFHAARLLADDLNALGINTDCAPVLDVPVPGAHDVIGDRAYGREPLQIAALGRAVADGFMAGGVLPVIKHIPGHGRATADSHYQLPVVTETHAVLSETDFAPFKALRDMPVAMTAHVVFTAIDDAQPASTSKRVTQDVIRGEIGFDGLLMSDDIGMEALSGTPADRARAAIDAGNDLVLHCSGKKDEMEAIATAIPPLSDKGRERLRRAMGQPGQKAAGDLAALIEKRDALLALV